MQFNLYKLTECFYYKNCCYYQVVEGIEKVTNKSNLVNMSSKKTNKNISAAFDFLPIVREILQKIASPETSEKDISTIANQFSEKMKEAQKILHNTPGLELTEEEQIQKIAELEEMIKQKQHLIDECTKQIQEWNNEGNQSNE